MTRDLISTNQHTRILVGHLLSRGRYLQDVSRVRTLRFCSPQSAQDSGKVNLLIQQYNHEKQNAHFKDKQVYMNANHQYSQRRFLHVQCIQMQCLNSTGKNLLAHFSSKVNSICFDSLFVVLYRLQGSSNLRWYLEYVINAESICQYTGSTHKKYLRWYILSPQDS